MMWLLGGCAIAVLSAVCGYFAGLRRGAAIYQDRLETEAAQPKPQASRGVKLRTVRFQRTNYPQQ